jgi:hypothetical protein
MSRSSVMAVPSNPIFGGKAAPRETHDSLVSHSRSGRTDVNGGSPELRSMAASAAHAAHVVSALLQAGETLVGRARSDALAFGQTGCLEGQASTALR